MNSPNRSQDVYPLITKCNLCALGHFSLAWVTYVEMTYVNYKKFFTCVGTDPTDTIFESILYHTLLTTVNL